MTNKKYYSMDCGCEFEINEEKLNGRNLDAIINAGLMPPLNFNIHEINMECPAIWSMLSKGLTKGVFQLESQLGMQWTKTLKPNELEQLSALGAILRPGCMECVSGDTKISVSINNREGRKFNDKKISMRELYEKFNNSHYLYKPTVISVDEKTLIPFTNKILKMFSNGVKDVYKPKFKIRTRYTENESYTLECTLEHKLLTKDRGWIELKDIKIGERVAIRNNLMKETQSNKESYFREICFTNYEYKCIFCDWNEGSLDVNHLQGNRKVDNSKDNLCFMCPNHHRMFSEKNISEEKCLEYRERYRLNYSDNIYWGELYELEYIGKKDTYDMMVDTNNNNYLAGNVLVHNCIDDTYGCTVTQLYCKRKNKELPVEYKYPLLKQILEATYGCMIYQEQAMQISQIVAGFNLQEADMLRKAIGKKLAEEMAKVKKMFISKSKEIGVFDENATEEIFGWIEKSQRYSFNKCVSKNTILKKDSGRFGKTEYTVEHMYKVRNFIEYAKEHGQLSLYKKWKLIKNYGKSYSMNEDGRIRPNVIVDIQPAGIQKVYKTTLENGAVISTTLNHKFPTSNGIKKLEELKVGDELYICGEYEQSDFKKINRFSNITQEELFNKELESNIGHNGFKTGEKNPGYTNGSFTDFQNAKKLIEKKCNKCGKTNGRLEFHHKDKDRNNSKIENIECLCASCHKKSDYKLGRTRKGEKGYPSLSCKIISIEFEEETETYDVTMEAPNHNFVVSSGIVTCNSHSLSYGVNGYWSAFIKAHFPKAFFISWLRHAKEKQKPLIEIRELINEAKLIDIEVSTPKIRSMKMEFFSTGANKIQFGLGNIKGVGDSQKVKIPTTINNFLEEKKLSIDNIDWLDYLIYVSSDISATVNRNFILVGALDELENSSRAKKLEEWRQWCKLTETEQKFIVERRSKYSNLADAISDCAKTKKEGGGCARQDRVEKLKDVVKLLINPPSELVDLPNRVAWDEEKLLGYPITYAKVDNFDNAEATCTCKEYIEGYKGNIILGVSIDVIREIKVKKGNSAGKTMAFLTVTDGSASLSDVCVFADSWEKYNNILSEGQCVLLYGKRDGKKGSFIIEKVVPMS